MVITMKVAIFQPYYRGWGGTERIAVELARYLPLEGITPIIIVPGKGMLTERLQQEGIPFRVVQVPPVLDVFGGGYYSFGIAQAVNFLGGFVRYNRLLAALLRREYVDLVILNGARAAVIAGLAPRLAMLPSVLYIHGYMHKVKHSRFQYVVDTWTRLCPSYFISVSEATLQDFASSLPRLIRRRVQSKAGVVYNWTSIVRRTMPRSDLKFPATLGTLATVVPNKGIHCLLEVAHDLREKGINFRLLVGGMIADDRYFEELVRKAEYLGVKELVEFCGLVDAEAFLPMLDMFLLASEREGMPLALLEAMAHGLPIVAFGAGGVSEALGFGEAGVVVPVGDVRAMADAVMHILTDGEERARLSRGALERSRQFSPTTQVPKLAAMLRTFASRAE